MNNKTVSDLHNFPNSLDLMSIMDEIRKQVGIEYKNSARN
jgi:hypothetical protein